MFSTEQKQKIAQAVEDALLSLEHPEMPTTLPRWQLHVDGAEAWSWANIVPNWVRRQEVEDD